ncbi:MAG: methyl-accepting chemotaxis protein [Cypionkella sp.]|jgi:methyl-accepting chemotaxis protein|nr:methyl-accepting chemotaxis protein [Cypionkella sp.]
MVILALFGVIAIGAGLLIGRWVARPLAALTDVTARLLAREDVTIPHKTRRDEVGDLSRGLECFRQDQIAADASRREMLFKGKAFDTTNTAMMISDAEGTLLYVNDALVNLFRSNLAQMRSRFPTMDVDRLIGTNISMFHSNHARVMTMLRDPQNAQMAPDVQIGTEVFGLAVNAVDAPDGTREGYVVVWEDVRELRRAKAVINAVESGQVLMEIGIDGRILAINDVGARLYGYAKDQIVGRPLTLLFKSTEAEAQAVVQRVVDRGSVTEFCHQIAQDGSDRFVICNLNIIRDNKGNAARILAICTDQTEETRFRQAAEAASTARSAELAMVVDRLRDTLAAMAEGDLSRSLDAPFPPDYETLRMNCNKALSGLSATLAQVSQVAQAILAGANDISTAASDLSRRTESQAATLEQTAAALDTLTANVRSATEGTLKAGGKVTSAHSAARDNGGVVQEAIAAMGAIEQSSHQISRIISVIDDIAFQTNLLALNAGVEAARAGDAGRGFAVVAAEVRALAQRSSDAAKEIKDLISTSESQVGTGAALVGKSGNAVEAIVADVAEISTIVQQIAQSAQDQANSLAEINAGVAMLDKVTQQNAVMVEQSTAASALLRQEADDLSALLSGFRLEGQARGRVTPHAA